MKYPKRLKIGDRYYRIRFVKSIRGCNKPIGQGAIVGLCDPNKYEILIKIGMSDDETTKTLIHELGHCFENEYDINISHKAVYQLEEAMFDFLVANFNK